MTTVLAILLRATVMLLGYVSACLAASAFMHMLFLGSQGLEPPGEPGLALAPFAVSVPIVALFIASFALLPAAAAILLAELLGRRDWLSYALAGGAVGLVIVALFWQGSLPITGGFSLADAGLVSDPALVGPPFFGLVIGGGIVGGISYWLVAGQFARRGRSMA